MQDFLKSRKTVSIAVKSGCCWLLFILSQPLAAESISLISDLNGRYGSTDYSGRLSDAIGLILQNKPDLVISSGDMVAGQKQPQLGADQLDQMWQSFNQVVTEPLEQAGIPFIMTPGNHDASAFPQYALEQQRYREQWLERTPELELLAGSEWPTRYAAQLGSILLITFDGTRPGKLHQRELDFLQEMLGNYGQDATVTIIFSHLPMWPLATGREHEIIDDPELLALMHRNGVDVYASGHHHVFFAGTDSEGMIHLGVGALGGNARAFSGSAIRQPHSFASLNIIDDKVEVISHAAPAFTSTVTAENLPQTIQGPLGTLQRFDGPMMLRP